MSAFQNPSFGRPRLLIIGCGDVGSRLLPQLVRTHRVFVLTSQASKALHFREQGAVPIVGNLDDRASLQRIAKLAPIVIHLAPPNLSGSQDKRTQNLLQILSQGGVVRKLIYISTSGVYGDCQGEWVSEERSVCAQSDRAMRRVDAEQSLRAWGARTLMQTVILRVPGIYAQNRLPIERFKAQTPALNAQEDVFTNHIHADDLAHLIRLTIFRGTTQRIYNASDFSELKMGEYFDLVAKALGYPLVPRQSRHELENLVAQGKMSAMLLSFMQESRRLKNTRLAELGFQFKYPTIQDFLRQLHL